MNELYCEKFLKNDSFRSWKKINGLRVTFGIPWFRDKKKNGVLLANFLS